MHLIDLFNALGMDVHNCGIQLDGGSHLAYKMPVDPIRFLSQAEDDFKNGGDIALANSLANSKRSISCQMDQVLLTFGFDAFALNIPEKLQLIKELGLFSPSLLRRVSAARNLLEHEYVIPTKERAEESLEIATLFVYAMKLRIKPFPDEITIYNEKPGVAEGNFESEITLGLSEENGKVKFVAHAKRYDKNPYGVLVGEAEIPNSDPIFTCLVRACNALDMDYRVEEALANLEQQLTKP